MFLHGHQRKLFQYEPFPINRDYPGFMARPVSFTKRRTSCFKTPEHLLHSHKPIGLNVQGSSCVLQRRPIGARLPPSALIQSSVNREAGRHVNSAQGRLENRRGPGPILRGVIRPSTAWTGGESMWTQGDDDSYDVQQDAGEGRCFSKISKLHLYLPSSSIQDEEQDIERGDTRPAEEEGSSLLETTEVNTKQSILEASVFRDPSSNYTSQQDGHTKPERKQEPMSPSRLQEPSDDDGDIMQQGSGGNVSSVTRSENHSSGQIMDNRVGLCAPKQPPHGQAGEKRRKCNPLLLVPAAVQKRRPPTSVKKHGSHMDGLGRLPIIKTTKTLEWGPHGPQEIKTRYVLQGHLNTRTSIKTQSCCLYLIP